MIEFDIDEYNKRFAEETKDCAKICNGKPCPYADECEIKVFCDERKKKLHYIKGMIPSDAYYSFKNMCRRDCIPEDGYDRKGLELFYGFGKISFPEIMPPPIDVWVDELREMGLYKEESEE